jgi:hypothetical protein
MDRNHKKTSKSGIVNLWSEEEVNVLSDMYKANMSYDDIGHALGKSWGAIKSQVAKQRKTRLADFPLRSKDTIVRVVTPPEDSLFDMAWHGTVPFGHWSITKAWGGKKTA